MNVLCIVSLYLRIKFLILIKPPFMCLGAVNSELCLNFSMQPLGSSLFVCSFLVIPAARAFYVQYMELGFRKDGFHLKMAGNYVPLLPVCIFIVMHCLTMGISEKYGC